MAISFDRALGVHDDALFIREQRAQLLANNLANANTPQFKARDIDFRALIRDAMDTQGTGSLRATERGHFDAAAAAVDGALLYRVPMQPSLDGNTVDTEMELSIFARNALDYQASLTFLQGSLRSLKSAIRGE